MVTYRDLGISPVINASGRMTLLGASILDPEVAEAMVEASKCYVNVQELEDRAGERIAAITGAEAGCVTAGAASGIAIGVAAFLAGADLGRIQALPDATGLEKTEIIIQTGHLCNFAAMARQAGATLIPIGWTNFVARGHLESAVREHTAGFLYIISHHVVQKGMLSLAECIEVCHARGVPVLVDAAAEEDLTTYAAMGADLITYSGGKAIGGPSFGMLCGKAEYVRACRAQAWGIARAMKVTKEGILGFLTALELYARRDQEGERRRQEAIIELVQQGLRGLAGTSVGTAEDEAGRKISRVELRLDETRLGFTALDLIQFLRSGSPPIVTRDHKANLGVIAIDPRPIGMEEAEVIVRRILEFYALQAKAGRQPR
jgi:L-seryl-tRNA(Ser) seleniumtransferase/D-glucosaminate-6-phosphate ammonia-lyase